MAELRETLSTKGHQKHWYFMLHSHVFGPTRLDDMDDWSPDEKLLVCYDANSGWIRVSDLMRSDGKLSITPSAVEP